MSQEGPEHPRKNEKSTESIQRIESGEEKETVENPNPWILPVTTVEETCQLKLTHETLPRRGPTYKNAVEDRIKTKVLLDHGAQVSLARQELLPMI